VLVWLVDRLAQVTPLCSLPGELFASARCSVGVWVGCSVVSALWLKLCTVGISGAR
jgi:hypothetical protein